MRQDLVFDPKNAFSNENRMQVFGYLRRYPGSRGRQISRGLGMNRGTVKYHLSVLERSGVVEKKRSGSGVFNFVRMPFQIPSSQGSAPSMQQFLVVRNRRHAFQVAQAIHASPGIIQRTLGDMLGISRKVLRQTLNDLVEENLVREQRVSKSCHYRGTKDLDALLAYFGSWPGESLQNVSPSTNPGDESGAKMSAGLQVLAGGRPERHVAEETFQAEGEG